MASPTVFDLLQIRNHLKFQEGPWHEPETFPTISSEPILAITKRGDDIAGHSQVYSIIQVKDGVKYRRFIDLDLQPKEEVLPLDVHIIKWKEVTVPVPGYGLLGEYWTNINLEGERQTWRFENVNYIYTPETPPYGGGPYNGFSARWTGWVRIPETGDYRFRTISDDGVRLWLDDVLYINNWGTHAPFTNNTPIMTMVKGYVKFQMDYFQQFQNGQISLLWSTPETNTQFFNVIPKEFLYTPGFYVE